MNSALRIALNLVMFFFISNAAFAHPGHLSALNEGHSHWLALIIFAGLTVAFIIAVVRKHSIKKQTKTSSRTANS